MERATATADPATIELVRRHRGRLLAVARRHSLSPEDAEDAFQRAVEILLRRAPAVAPGQLLPWMTTVVKREAWAVRRQRSRHGEPSAAEQIEPFAGIATGTAELAERRDRLRLGAEALGRLKPQEVRALLLRAEGLSYREICDRTGWSYTKVNRCLSEGRRSFLARVAGIEGGAECDRLRPVLSALADGEASAADLAALRPHLSGCLACRARLREYRGAPAAAAAVAPAGLLGWLVSVLRDAAAGAAGLAQVAGAQKLAVVGSAAVLAGGGAVAVVPEVAGPSRPDAAAVEGRRPAARPPAPPPVSASRPPATAPPAAPRPDRAASRSRRAAARPGRAARSSPRSSARAAPVRQRSGGESGAEFAPPSAPPPPALTPRAPTAPVDPAGGEFAP